MKFRIATATMLALHCTAGCTPAAQETAASNPSASSPAADEEIQFDDLQPIDIASFKAAPVITDFIPAECNLSGTKEDDSKWKIAWCNSDESDEGQAYMSKLHREMAGQQAATMLMEKLPDGGRLMA